MQPAARKGDPTIHLGMVAEGSPNVTIGGMPAARLVDKHLCPMHGPGPITQSSMTVFINGVGAARMGDMCTCMVPSTPVGEGNAKKEEQASWKFSGDGGMENKKGEYEGESKDLHPNAKDALKDAKDQFKGKDDEGWKPKFAVGANKEMFNASSAPKGPDGKPVDNYAGFFHGEAKGSYGAQAEIENWRNMKANAGGKIEGEASVAKAKGKLGDAKTGFGEVEGEAKFLTVKGDLGAGGEFEMKNGKVDKAYVQGGGGVGASVVEGKASGKTKAFKLPFVNWGISFGGEVSGSLLTAEARANAQAGYKEGKWTFGFGAKLGALVAGLGFKFNVTIEKIEPPEEPPKAPGIPGVTGIDPIAIGHMTTLIGNMPPPYIPGAPEPVMPGSHTDAIGIRNTSQALTLQAAKRSAVPFTPVKCSW
jgi:uncharacterized Zn-binding protein involved in type VI secretion